MKTMSVALKAHYASGTTTLATLWKAVLRDGTVVATTSHSSNITYDGLEYLSTAAYTASAIESGSDLSPDNMEVEGFLASPQIVFADLYSGRWDYAYVEMFEVNYKGLTMGRSVRRAGHLGEVRISRSKFAAELRGLGQMLSRKIVRLTTKDCLWDLGSTRCGVNLAAYTVTGAVDTVTDNRVIAEATRVEAADHFVGGKLTFDTGLNAGLSMEVKDYSVGVLTLHQSMPYDIAVGDTYTVYHGCQKRFTEDCVGVFNNGVNFGGFPHLPQDRAYKVGGTDE